MITLYTPGHHEVTDTLIMYGLVKVIKTAEPLAEINVVPFGERFLLEVDLTETELLKYFRRVGKNILENIIKTSLYTSIPSTLRVHMLQRGNEGGRNVLMNGGKLDYKSQSKDGQLENIYHSYKFLENISEKLWKDFSLSEEHKYSTGSKVTKVKCGGRSKTKTLVTANLSIAPYAGTVQKVGSFYLCKLCSALAWIGLWHFSARVIVKGKNVQNTYIHLIKPESPIQGEFVLMSQNIGQISSVQIPITGKDIPLLSMPFILLAFGETSAAMLKAQWKSLMYIISSERRGPNWKTAIRSYCTYPINNLMLFFEKAKIYSYNVARLVNALLKNNDGIQALSMFSEAIIYRDIDLLYRAVRFMSNVLTEQNVLDDGIIKAAFEVCG